MREGLQAWLTEEHLVTGKNTYSTSCVPKQVTTALMGPGGDFTVFCALAANISVFFDLRDSCLHTDVQLP